MGLKTGKLNGRILLAAIVLLLAAGAVAVMVTALRREPAPETAYTEIAGKVRFAERTTTEAEYGPLLAACDDCRSAAEQTEVQTDSGEVVVSEATFVDAEEPTEPAEMPVSETESFVESETIYFEGFVLVRYTSLQGGHLTCAACYDESGAPLVLSLDGLAAENLIGEPLETDLPEEGIVDEADYLSDVKGCVMALLFDETDADAVSARFTESGAAALRRVGQLTGGVESSGAQIPLCAVGSTDSGEMLADRIYLRCVLSVNGEPMVLDLLLKLNNELLIYDVDLM